VRWWRKGVDHGRCTRTTAGNFPAYFLPGWKMGCSSHGLWMNPALRAWRKERRLLMLGSRGRSAVHDLICGQSGGVRECKAHAVAGLLMNFPKRHVDVATPALICMAGVMVFPRCPNRICTKAAEANVYKLAGGGGRLQTSQPGGAGQ